MLNQRSSIALPFALISMVGCSNQAVPQPEPAFDVAATEMRADLTQLHDLVCERWAYLETSRSEADLKRVHDRLSAKVTDRTTAPEFAEMLEEYISALHDGHAQVDTRQLKPPSQFTWPIGFAVVENAVVIGNLNWLKDNPTLAIGDELLSVNGVPVDELIETEMQKTSASTNLSRRLLALDQLHWTDKATIQIEIERADGSLIAQEFPCLPGEVDYRFREPTLFCTTEHLTDKVFLIRVPSFTWNSAEFFAAQSMEDRERAISAAKDQVDLAFRSIGASQMLILDLRGNTGGFELLSSYFVEHLVEGDFLYYTTTRRDTSLVRDLPGANTAEFGNAQPQYPRQWQDVRHFTGPPYVGPTVVLIDSRCFSTTDNLCAFLKDSRPQTRFVGMPTGAGTGEPMTVGHLKHSGVAVQFCISRIHSPQGRLIEGAGTIPDVLVNRTQSDIIARRDTAMEAAINELENWETRRR